MLKISLTSCCILFVNLLLFSQSLSWTETPEPQIQGKSITPSSYRTMQVNFEELKAHLLQAPLEQNQNARGAGISFEMPTPEGNMATFKILESPIMSPGLQERYRGIRTFAGTGTGDYKGASIRLDFTPKGFHAQVLHLKKSYYIDPYSTESVNTYIVYSRVAFFQGNTKTMPSCTVLGESTVGEPSPEQLNNKDNTGEEFQPAMITSNGTHRRTYDLALAATAEYTAFHGGTVPLALAAMTTTMNRVNGIYIRDLSMRMLLIDDTDDLIYTNAITDPYSNFDAGDMLGQNQSNIDMEIGSSNYDIGHVFATVGSGIATLESPCNNSIKARGVSGQASPEGDPFDVDYVAHEMGHQWGATHTQNNTCNRTPTSAYEPGSASTIMGYAGICAPNLQSNSDAHFHNKSFTQMVEFTNDGDGDNCAQTISIINTAPSLSVRSSGFHIPKSTPFELTASATDGESDPITYCWEQYDLGPPTSPGDNNLTNPSANAPIFRSFPPTSNPTRVFPKLPDLVNNTTDIGEHLPTYARDLTFRCTARDNYIVGGGVNDAQVSFDVAGNSGPFIVTNPNTNVNWGSNSTQNVSWNVANTNSFPVSCNNVDIYLSIDGGYTYPYQLLNNTSNDGSASVTLPDVESNQARIKVKGDGNIFFDISNQNFTISAQPENSAPCNAETVLCGQTISGSTLTANQSDVGSPSCAEGSQNDLFYTLEAIAGVEYIVTVNGENYDGVLAAYTGSCDQSLAEVACSDEGLSSGIEESIEFSFESNTTVLLQTYDWSVSGGEFELIVDCEIPNDSPCSAIDLFCSDPHSNTTVGANTSDFGTPSCTSGSGNDTWYKFDAVAGTTYTITVNGDNYDGVLALYGPSCILLPPPLGTGEPNELACADNGLSPGIAETITYTAEESGQLLIQTYDWSVSGGEFTISLSGEIANDSPCDATTIACDETLSGTTQCAEPTSGPVCYLGIGDNFNVFYQFEAEANGVYEATLSGLEQLGSLSAMTGDCGGSLSILECDYTFGTSETITFTSSVDQIIYLRADHFTGYIDSFEISLECLTPDNDECDDAEPLTLNNPGECPANSIEGTTIGATASGLPGVCESSTPDVFYSFNSGAFGAVNVNLAAGTATDLVVSVISNNCAGTQVLCTANPTTNTEIDVDPNSEYIVRLSTNMTFGDPGTFDLCVEGVYDCPVLSANIGDSCNDGDPGTSNDTVTADCECEGSSSDVPLNVSVNFNSSCAPRDVSVKLYEPGTTNLLHTYNTTVGVSGNFSLPAAIGTFDIFVKVEGYLQVGLGLITISAPSGSSIAFGTLDGGDINGDNVVNILDISAVNASFGSSIGDSNYSEIADFNCDGNVNILDVSGLNSNFGSSGMAAPFIML